ncbi:MAG: M24 family metallopeptidase [Gammaproteobacteria bacterium]|nr:M24 family metallopeptidase [Gammaproteobacteria bacterium]
MITRRNVLKTGIGAAGAAGAAAALAAPAPAAAAELRPNNLAERVKRVRAGPLMNLEQAYRVMEEEQLDGLVLAEPINVFHLTGHWGSLAKMGYPAPAYALLSKDQRQAPGLVMAQFIYYYTYADGYFDFPLQTWLFSGWDRRLQNDDSSGQPGGEPPANPAYIFEDKGEVDLREIEVHRRSTLHAALSEHKLSADARWALVNAVRGMGLDRGRIGVDHLVVNAIFETAGLDAVPVYADRALRRIRAIKSPREIELMTFSAQANAEAALVAARAARAGATYQELRAAFFSEAAKRGNLGVFMQVDTIGAETGDGEFREGQAFQIDCVSHGFHYHGDYGRTVFLGEPSRSMKQATDAIALGWDAIMEALRPGLRYSEIRPIGMEAIRKAGHDLDVAFTPHSVGLMHTDDPGRADSPFYVKEDVVLAENMIISVDCPVRNVGLGGSAHLEDLTLITADGGVQINDIGDRVIVV